MVPRYVIAMAGGKAAGRRLPKLEKFIVPAREYHKLPPAPNKLNLNVLESTKNNLKFCNEEFRFWCLDTLENGKPFVAICRSCEKAVYLPESRQEHKSEHGCTTSLVEAYKLLLRHPVRCVICDSPTNGSKWGVPLCSTGNCINDWQYEKPQPDGLTSALLIVAEMKGVARG